MGIIADAEDWLLHVALKKVAIHVAGLAASYLAAHSGLGDKVGVSISVNPDALTAGIYGGFVFAHDWLKMHAPAPIAAWL